MEWSAAARMNTAAPGSWSVVVVDGTARAQRVGAGAERGERDLTGDPERCHGRCQRARQHSRVSRRPPLGKPRPSRAGSRAVSSCCRACPTGRDVRPGCEQHCEPGSNTSRGLPIRVVPGAWQGDGVLGRNGRGFTRKRIGTRTLREPMGRGFRNRPPPSGGRRRRCRRTRSPHRRRCTWCSRSGTWRCR